MYPCNNLWSNKPQNHIQNFGGLKYSSTVSFETSLRWASSIRQHIYFLINYNIDHIYTFFYYHNPQRSRLQNSLQSTHVIAGWGGRWAWSWTRFASRGTLHVGACVPPLQLFTHKFLHLLSFRLVTCAIRLKWYGKYLVGDNLSNFSKRLL